MLARNDRAVWVRSNVLFFRRPSAPGVVDPFAPNEQQCCHAHRAQEEANQTKCLQASKNADEDGQEGKFGRPAHQRGLRDVVAYHHARSTNPKRAAACQGLPPCRNKNIEALAMASQAPKGIIARPMVNAPKCKG